MATLADYGPEVRAEVKQVREVVATLHEQLIKWNLVVWTAGNVSQRLHTADLMVIKPSGLRYEYLTPSSMVVCDLDGNVVDGAEAPSSDTASHAYIYRHMPDVYGVVHTHSTYATAVLGSVILVFIHNLLHQLLPQNSQPLPSLFPAVCQNSILEVALLQVCHINKRHAPGIETEKENIPCQLQLGFE